MGEQRASAVCGKDLQRQQGGVCGRWPSHHPCSKNRRAGSVGAYQRTSFHGLALRVFRGAHQTAQGKGHMACFLDDAGECRLVYQSLATVWRDRYYGRGGILSGECLLIDSLRDLQPYHQYAEDPLGVCSHRRGRVSYLWHGMDIGENLILHRRTKAHGVSERERRPCRVAFPLCVSSYSEPGVGRFMGRSPGCGRVGVAHRVACRLRARIQEADARHGQENRRLCHVMVFRASGCEHDDAHQLRFRWYRQRQPGICGRQEPFPGDCGPEGEESIVEGVAEHRRMGTGKFHSRCRR